MMTSSQPPTPSVTNILKIAGSVTTGYASLEVAFPNNHVLRLSVMTSPYHWHYHPDSDETIIAIEGVLIIELESEIIELSPPANIYSCQEYSPSDQAKGRTLG